MNQHSIRTLSLNVLFVCVFLPRFTSSLAGAEEQAGRSNVSDILEHASRIAILQDEHESYWIQRVLLWIGSVQQRAGDFDDARNSIRKSNYVYGRNLAFVDLANALAAAGQREKALDVLHELGTEHGWRQDFIDDGVRLHWMAYLIAKKDLEKAWKVNDEIVAAESRPEGFIKLAVGYSKAGDIPASERYFRRAVESSATIPDEFARARALWQIADAQSNLGQTKSAAATIDELVKASAQFGDLWAKMCGLREAAERTARQNDRQTAAKLFQRAIGTANLLGKLNHDDAIGYIAEAQARAGFVDEALVTARKIEHSEDDFGRDAPREKALCEISVTQAKNDAMPAALSTALSIKYFRQYQDDALSEIAQRQLEKGEKDAALITAKRIPNSSRKAVAMLKIATAYARHDEQIMARTIAGQIQLQHENDFLVSASIAFAYTKPETWGILYEQASATSMPSISRCARHAEEVAAAAMTLAQTLHEKPDASYANAFATVWEGEIIEAMARAHAAKGDAKEALAWARQIGSAAKIPAGSDNFEKQIAVEQRIYALVGVAEGMLDKRGERERAR